MFDVDTVMVRFLDCVVQKEKGLKMRGWEEE